MAHEPAGQASEKQSAIVSAAATVFARYGYHKTAMTDIIRASGASRGTVYKYFGSKAEVFRAVIFQEKKAAMAEIGAAAAAERTTRDKLKAVLITSLRAMEEKVNLYRLAMNACSEIFPAVVSEKKEIQARTNEIMEILRSVVREGIASGEVVVEDVDLAAEAFLTVFRGIMFGSFAGVNQRSAKELAGAVVDMFIDGLAAKGKA